MNPAVPVPDLHYRRFHPLRLSRIVADMGWAKYQSPLLRLHEDNGYLFWFDRGSVPGRFLSIFAVPVVLYKMWPWL